MIYSPEELLVAYQAWCATPDRDDKTRMKMWDAYCDARDGVPKGTSLRNRTEREAADKERAARVREEEEKKKRAMLAQRLAPKKITRTVTAQAH